VPIVSAAAREVEAQNLRTNPISFLMANEELLKILRQGVDAWNEWRQKNPDVRRPDLHGAYLSGADLSRANLLKANLLETDLSQADLSHANLRQAYLSGDLREAYLSGADLSEAALDETRLIRTDLRSATLYGSYVYGAAVWDIKVDDETKQQNLVITPYDQATITVDNIKVAQFIYLLLNNKEIRDVIDTVGRKGVLLLGRFTEGRIAVLERLQEELRKRDFLPMVFNFDKPEVKDFTETVRLLPVYPTS
jgi:hypothetical protein